MDRPQLQRLRHRGRHLTLDAPTRRPDPAEEVASALAPLLRTTVAAGLALAALAASAPGWTGDGRAALLAGLPAVAALTCAWVGRPAPRRRVAMILATTTMGLLGLATAGSVATLGDLLGGAADARAPRGAGYPLACLVVAALHLAAAWPCWRSANAEGDAAAAARALYDEL